MLSVFQDYFDLFLDINTVPWWINLPTTVVVPENAVAGYNVLKGLVADKDIGDTYTYSVTYNTADGDDYFAVDPASKYSYLEDTEKYVFSPVFWKRLLTKPLNKYVIQLNPCTGTFMCISVPLLVPVFVFCISFLLCYIQGRLASFILYTFILGPYDGMHGIVYYAH